MPLGANDVFSNKTHPPAVEWTSRYLHVSAQVAALLQLNRPVSIIQELLPGRIPLVRQPDINHRRALGLDRLGDQVHVRLIRRAAAFLDVALQAAADDVFPGASAALALGLDVVERQLGRRKLLPAVL